MWDPKLRDCINRGTLRGNEITKEKPLEMLLPNSDSYTNLVGLCPGDLDGQSELKGKSKPYLTEL